MHPYAQNNSEHSLLLTTFHNILIFVLILNTVTHLYILNFMYIICDFSKNIVLTP